MGLDYSQIEVIGFDADDTLWVNETYFREAEQEFAMLLSQYETPNKIDQELFKKEIANLPMYGYGVKGFMLSMVEMALELSNYGISAETIDKILQIGKDMINKPVELLGGIEGTLAKLSEAYRLIVVTKGDLLDQERKLEKSGLLKYFHHIEVLSEKLPTQYGRLLSHLDIPPQKFLMIGNSLKSDILPVLELGSMAIHIPFHTTWQFETVAPEDHRVKDYQMLDSVGQLPAVLLNQ